MGEKVGEEVKGDDEQDWYFTWGFNQGHDDCYTVIHGTWESARQRMTELWGIKWGFQYPSAEAAGVERWGLKRIS